MSQRHEDYKVAIICALGFEMTAVRYMLDEEHSQLPTRSGDKNMYTLGKLSGHHVALACLPGSQGKGAAATVATNMARTFPAIEWKFLVGIGGGVPNDRNDIRLGDVVVSMPEGTYGGVVQYDMGKDMEDEFRQKGFLQPPPALLRSAAERMQSDHFIRDNKIQEYLEQMLKKGPRLSKYKRPPTESDVLYESTYPHTSSLRSCKDCDKVRAVPRLVRSPDGPEIHYGLIASGDRVLQSAVKRDAIVEEVGDILCFEMEAAGITTEFSCLVIRGISDYADSHKNDDWHHYAAAAAAGCAREILSLLTPAKVRVRSIKRHKSTHTFQGTGIMQTGRGSISAGNIHIGEGR